MSSRAKVLADRIARGAENIAAYAEQLTDAQWATPIVPDGRKAGVMIHHVANMYPLEIQLAQMVARGEPVVDVTWAAVDKINAEHAQANDRVTKEAALELLERNSTEAARAIRALSDEELNRAVTVSLNADAPLTCQFVLEDHAVRHSYHHLGRIRAALKASR